MAHGLSMDCFCPADFRPHLQVLCDNDIDACPQLIPWLSTSWPLPCGFPAIAAIFCPMRSVAPTHLISCAITSLMSDAAGTPSSSRTESFSSDVVPDLLTRVCADQARAKPLLAAGA